MLAIAADGQPASSTNIGHMATVLADPGPTNFPGLPSFIGREFVRSASLMGRSATFACNGALSLSIHAGKPTFFGLIIHISIT